MINLVYLMYLIKFQTSKITLSLSLKPLTENPPIEIYVNKIKNRIVFKIKAGYNTVANMIIPPLLRTKKKSKIIFSRENRPKGD